VLPDKSSRSKATRDAAVENADDAELQALDAGLNVDVALDDALLDDRISETLFEAVSPSEGEMFDPSATAIDDIQKLEEYSETLIGLASQVITSRAQLLGKAYPFAMSGNHVRYTGSKTQVYEFCLTASNVPNISDNNFKPALMLFEQLTGLVMSCFLGSAGQYYHTGFPGSGMAIEAHVKNLDKIMPGEWKWNVETLKKKSNDGGVDVVVWKRADERTKVGSLIFVGNSGCGKNWQDKGKHRERPADKLEMILNRPRPRHLHNFLSLPFHIYDEGEWSEASHEAHFVLDRIRLAGIAEAQDVEVWKNEAAKLRLPLADGVRLLHPSANITA
jgi:hypothetical protein